MSDEETDDGQGYTGELKAVYSESEGYRVVPATSVSGGTQPFGNFVLTFLADHLGDPDNETYHFSDGEIKQVEGTPSPIFRREKQVTINMTQNDAFSAAAWVIASILGPEVTEEDIRTLVYNEYSEQFANQGDDT